VAQCPTSPNYHPDFTLNQTCLTLNGELGNSPTITFPTFPVTSGTVLRLTPNVSNTAASAWYTTQQPVSGAFTTTFSFQLSGTTSEIYGPADGIAFVIQNSSAGVTALGPEGCGIGYGSSPNCTAGNPGPQVGITNSVAIEFNSYYNQGTDPSNSDVAIQSCLTNPNSVDDSGACSLAVKDLNHLINIGDGAVHTVTISYSGAGSKLLDVIVDNVDLFSGGIVFDMTTIGLNSGNAWVGFTAATGGGNDNQDILSWTFTPQAETATISTTSPTSLNFPNAAGSNVYAYTAQLTAPYTTPEIQVQPILMTPSACDALVQQNFWPARCFVYNNAENSGLNASVMFSVTCPTSSTGTCGSNVSQNFFAELGTTFGYVQSENPWIVYPGIFAFLNPFPGWLKGAGPDPLNPCTPPANGPLFQSNQIDSFFIDGGTTKGKSQGGGSCWVATYDTPGELWPFITVSSPKPTTYKLNSVVPANYVCSNPITSQPVTSPTGPYLTTATCTQSSGAQSSCTQTGSGLSCTGSVNTSTKGLHQFVVTAIDSGGNQNLYLVLYNVK